MKIFIMLIVAVINAYINICLMRPLFHCVDLFIYRLGRGNVRGQHEKV